MARDVPGEGHLRQRCLPYNAALGAEESYWLAVHSTREALAEALAEMVDEGEISEPEALHFAHMYLHDTAASLYPPLHVR